MGLRRRALIATAPLLGVLAACSDDGADPNRVNQINRDRFVSGDGANYRWEDPDERPEAPVVTGESLEGDPLDTSDWAGKVLAVNFWGSWCAPCRSEAPFLVEAEAEFSEDDVQFVGVNIRDTVDAALAFDQRYGITYPSFNDAGGEIALQFIDYEVAPNTIPVTFIIDRDQRIFSVWREDFKDSRTLIADIEKAFET